MAALCHPAKPHLPSGSRAIVLCWDWNSSIHYAWAQLPITGSCTTACLPVTLATEQKI